MDQSFAGGLESHLERLLARLSDRLPPRDLAIASEFNEHSEWGLALDQIAYSIGEYDIEINSDEQDAILRAARAMGIEPAIANELGYTDPPSV